MRTQKELNNLVQDENWACVRVDGHQGKEPAVFKMHFPVYFMAIPSNGAVAMEVDGVLKCKLAGVDLWDSLAHDKEHRCENCQKERDDRAARRAAQGNINDE